MTEELIIEEQFDSLEILDLVPATPKSGIQYQTPPLSGQLTSYANFDDAYNLAAGRYGNEQLDNPEYMAELDHDALDPYRTLKNSNAFGNLSRFTDDLGGQDYANAYVIDHLYNRAFAYLGYSYNWATALTTAEASEAFGFNDWRLPSAPETYVSFMGLQVGSGGLRELLPWAIFGFANNGANWTSTTAMNNSIFAYVALEGNITLGALPKANGYGLVITRKHY